LQRLAVVDHVMRAQLLDPLAGFRTRGGADDGQAGQLARQLHQDGANAARRADHQQRLALRGASVAAHFQTVEQQFPRGDGGQRQRCGLGEVDILRLVADDALVHQMQLAVGAGAGQVAGVPDFIADLEQGHVRADRFHHAGGIPADHLGLAFGRGDVAADLGVDRIDRNGAHFDQQIAAGSLRRRQFDIDQGVGVVDRQGLAVGDGFHVMLQKSGDGVSSFISSGEKEAFRRNTFKKC
jgi:hypothetical protein